MSVFTISKDFELRVVKFYYKFPNINRHFERTCPDRSVSSRNVINQSSAKLRLTFS